MFPHGVLVIKQQVIKHLAALFFFIIAPHVPHSLPYHNILPLQHPLTEKLSRVLGEVVNAYASSCRQGKAQ